MFLVIKGTVTTDYSFPIKVVIDPSKYPKEQGAIYLDMALSYKVLNSKPYLGAFNQIKIPNNTTT